MELPKYATSKYLQEHVEKKKKKLPPKERNKAKGNCILLYWIPVVILNFHLGVATWSELSMHSKTNNIRGYCNETVKKHPECVLPF
jgi:hypothetical protein